MTYQIMTYATEDLVKALKAARKAKGLNQRELGALAGLPQSHISKIETGRADIRISSLVELARILELDVRLVPRKALPAIDTVVRSVMRTSIDAIITREKPGGGVTSEPPRPAYSLEVEDDA
jgi:transcriptional regulator with XRE-family HTH domain